MKKIIKFNIGKISVYLLIYALSQIINIIFVLLGQTFSKDLYIIDIYMEQLGQIIGGLSIYLYQYNSIIKNKKTKYFWLKFMKDKANLKEKDKKLKILILIFFSSIFDFFIIIFEYHFFVEINGKISQFFKFRIGVITTIVSSLLCAGFLNFKFGKHHKFSSIILSVILIMYKS